LSISYNGENYISDDDEILTSSNLGLKMFCGWFYGFALTPKITSTSIFPVLHENIQVSIILCNGNTPKLNQAIKELCKFL